MVPHQSLRDTVRWNPHFHAIVLKAGRDAEGRRCRRQRRGGACGRCIAGGAARGLQDAPGVLIRRMERSPGGRGASGGRAEGASGGCLGSGGGSGVAGSSAASWFLDAAGREGIGSAVFACGGGREYGFVRPDRSQIR